MSQDGDRDHGGADRAQPSPQPSPQTRADAAETQPLPRTSRSRLMRKPEAGEDKDEAAFRTISEVAEILATPAHVLRFWETRFPQVKPMKRAGGRRYYRPADLALLAAIRHLLHDQGLTIRGAQKQLRDEGPRALAELGQRLLDEAPAHTGAGAAEDADATASTATAEAPRTGLFDTLPQARAESRPGLSPTDSSPTDSSPADAVADSPARPPSAKPQPRAPAAGNRTGLLPHLDLPRPLLCLAHEAAARGLSDKAQQALPPLLARLKALCERLADRTAG